MSDLIAGIVLAGGRSSRMGGWDKAMIPLAGQTLLKRAIEKLESQVGVLAINSNADPKTLDVDPRQVITDTIPGYAGPLAGILSGLEWASSRNATYLATVACDTPFFPDDFVARLRKTNGKIAIATSAGRVHPVFGLWHVGLARDVQSYLQTDARRSVLAFVELHEYARVEFELHDDVDPFYNINTQSDLDAVERMVRKLAL